MYILTIPELADMANAYYYEWPVALEMMALEAMGAEGLDIDHFHLNAFGEGETAVYPSFHRHIWEPADDYGLIDRCRTCCEERA